MITFGEAMPARAEIISVDDLNNHCETINSYRISHALFKFIQISFYFHCF